MAFSPLLSDGKALQTLSEEARQASLSDNVPQYILYSHENYCSLLF